MATGVRSRYHIAINGNGFMLRGAPTQPRYIKEQAPSLVNQLGVGDISYAQLNGSGWSYWTQTDWSGGFQQLKWKDNASFKDGQSVEVSQQYGRATLQHRYTFQGSFSGKTLGAIAVHDGFILVGTVRSGAAVLGKLTSAAAASNLSAYAGISAVNSFTRFQNSTLAGLTRTSGTLKTLVKITKSAVSGIRNTNPIVRAVKTVGIRAYLSEYESATSGDRLSYTTNLSTYTSAYFAGINRKIKFIEDLGGVPYFLIQDAQTVELWRWDELSERAYSIYIFDNLTNFGITRYFTILIISGTSNGKSVAYAFNGARLWQIFDDQVLDSSYDFSRPFIYRDNLQVKGAQWDGEVWSPGIQGVNGGLLVVPVLNFFGRAYGYSVSANAFVRVLYYDSTLYAVSGHIISSEFGSNIAGVDKLVNSVNVNCKALASGESIELLRSTDGGTTFTTIGTASYATDGAITKKNMYLPSGFVTKLWNYKAQLRGSGSSTPTLLDVTFEYRPIPDLKKRWTVSLDAGDNIRLLNRQVEQRDGKALIQQLWLEKEAKRAVVYEDVDSFEVNLVSAMSSTATTARVNNTRLMPPAGRMRTTVSGVVEEMKYTSADGNTIRGITRGQKGTLARAYTTAHKLNNFYNIVISDVREQVNNTDENTTESVATVTLLEV